MAKIAMIPIESSQIKSVGYDSKQNTLYIEFNTGAVYAYNDVPDTHFKMLCTPTLSAGSYFSKEIRTHYEYVKLDVIIDEGMITI